jgi:hypothetical protein
MSDLPGRCRACGSDALRGVLDLGEQPVSGDFVLPSDAGRVERVRLRAAVCSRCWWMQLVDDTPDEPSAGPAATVTSTSIRQHARDLAAWLTETLSIGPHHRILEVASHGNVLAGFLHDRAITNTLTIERHPWALEAAREAGLAVYAGRLDPETAAELTLEQPFDLVLDTFDLSHRRQPVEELAGIARAIGDGGSAVVEVEHVLPVLEHARFDSIRHGHFGYPSLTSLQAAAAQAGLEVVAAIRTPIYGGSLRVVLAPIGARTPDESVERLLAVEHEAGLDRPVIYDTFAPRVAEVTGALRRHLEAALADGRRVAGYGAGSRASALLNAAQIGRELLPRIADASPNKQGREVPGVRIPIVDPADLLRDQPDEVLVLTWSIVDEVVDQLRGAGLRDSRFVVPLPELRVVAEPSRPGDR